jgi:hypothetical protein
MPGNIEGGTMLKIRIAVSLFALLATLAVLVAPASAEFKDEKGGEAIKIKGGKTSIKVGLRQTKCEKLKGSGFIVGKQGKTGEVASEDEPASEAVKASSNAAFTLAFEECTTEIAGKKMKTTVNTEKCQFEINQDTEGEAIKPSTALLSLRAAKAKEPCNTIIQVGEIKCEVKIAGEHANENEYLPTLKLKNTKGVNSEIEISSVKEIEVASVSKGCELTAAEEKEVKAGKATEISVEEKITVEGMDLKGPNISVSEGIMNFGTVVEATKANTFKNDSATEVWEPGSHTLTTARRGGVPGSQLSVWTIKDKCGGETIAANGGTCMVEVKFNPMVGVSYKAFLRVQGAPLILMEGKR